MVRIFHLLKIVSTESDEEIRRRAGFRDDSSSSSNMAIKRLKMWGLESAVGTLVQVHGWRDEGTTLECSADRRKQVLSKIRLEDVTERTDRTGGFEEVCVIVDG